MCKENIIRRSVQSICWTIGKMLLIRPDCINILISKVNSSECSSDQRCLLSRRPEELFWSRCVTANSRACLTSQLELCENLSNCVQEREGSEVCDVLHDVCLLPHIVRVGKSMTMRWAKHVERTRTKKHI